MVTERASEQVATSSSSGSRVMSERNDSWHLWPADGQKANWRMCGAPCARRVRFFVPPAAAPATAQLYPSPNGRWGELRYVSRPPPPPRKFVRACARALPCALVTSRPPPDGRTVMWRRPSERPTTKRDIGKDGRTGAAGSSPNRPHRRSHRRHDARQTDSTRRAKDNINIILYYYNVIVSFIYKRYIM